MIDDLKRGEKEELRLEEIKAIDVMECTEVENETIEVPLYTLEYMVDTTYESEEIKAIKEEKHIEVETQASKMLQIGDYEHTCKEG